MIIDKKLLGVVIFLFSISFFYVLPDYFSDYSIFFVIIIIIIIMAMIKSGKKR